MSNSVNYPTVMGKMEHLHPKCQKCVWLRKAYSNTMYDQYKCGIFPLMYPNTCSKIVEAKMREKVR